MKRVSVKAKLGAQMPSLGWGWPSCLTKQTDVDSGDPGDRDRWGRARFRTAAWPKVHRRLGLPHDA
jgi:hypothetical protein